jgi:hypothetical protein
MIRIGRAAWELPLRRRNSALYSLYWSYELCESRSIVVQYAMAYWGTRKRSREAHREPSQEERSEHGRERRQSVVVRAGNGSLPRTFVPARRKDNGCLRRVSPAPPRPREGLLTELTAGAQPWPRESVIMPQSRRRWFPFKNWIRRIEAETTLPRQVRARAAFVRT